jgi:hypothetical protein
MPSFPPFSHFANLQNLRTGGCQVSGSGFEPYFRGALETRTRHTKMTWGCDLGDSLPSRCPHGNSREIAATHHTREQRDRQETRAKARRYFFIFSSFFPLPEGGTSSRQPPLPRPRWRSLSRSARMGPRVRRAVALGERLGSGSRPGRPLRGAHSGADRGALQGDSGDCCCCWGLRLVRARLLLPLPPHIPPTLHGPRSVLRATNGRRVLSSQQPIAGGAATPHTPLSWKQTRHPRPATLALPAHQPPHWPRPRRRLRPRSWREEDTKLQSGRYRRCAQPRPAHLLAPVQEVP